MPQQTSANDAKIHITTLLKNLQSLPGVYQMLGKNGTVLYVGKAKNLKNRVSSYFNKTIDHPKTRALVARIVDFQVIITRSETEALLLEQNLIKEHRPPYNVMLRDDKSYLYIFMSVDKYPRLSYGRGKAKHKSGRFFGPFPQAQVAKETLELMQKLFMVRQCENSFFKQRTRPCLQYQIKRCKAPCVNLVSEKEYLDDVQTTLDFLQGKSDGIQENLIQKMETAAEELNFESAARFRDQLKMLRQVQSKQAVYKTNGEADVIAIKQEAGVVSINVMTVRDGKVLGSKNFFPDLDANLPETDNLEAFLMSFYFQVSDDLPNEIILNLSLDSKGAIEEALAQQYAKKTKIRHTVKETRASWQSMAALNADNGLQTKLATHKELQQRFLALKDATKRDIDRIECFDISHTMGEATIASCVVYDTGGKRKRDYRQYAIHGIKGGDDYAAMEQALTRRYKKQPLPDLLLIDGGKGQLTSANKVMMALGLQEEAFLLGVSKGEGRKAGLETLHFVNGDTLKLLNDNKALHLIQQVRDEAHRFAITNHRKKRDKKRSSSILEVIPGLGETRRRDLLNHFGGLQNVLSASEEEIASVKGIGKVLAKTIYKTLHE